MTDEPAPMTQEQIGVEMEKAAGHVERAIPRDLLPLVGDVRGAVKAFMQVVEELRRGQALTEKALEKCYNGIGVILRSCANTEERLLRIEGALGLIKKVK